MKVIIVGAGIAGMSAGIYARQSGFDVTIYESHSIAGGNSTSWKRNGYFIEGGMHWLVGSNKKTSLHKLWKEVGALQDNNPIYYRDPFLTYLGKDVQIQLTRDVQQLEKQLMQLSPQDETAIHQLIKDINAFKSITMPVTDIKGVKVKEKSKMTLSQILGYIKAGKAMSRLSKITIKEYLSRFQSREIQDILNSVIPMDEYSAMSMLFTLGGLAGNDSGYPKGGSLRMAQNMATTFQKLGGTIEYSKKVTKVNVENGQANGVWVDGEIHSADAIIITADTRVAIDTLFDQPLQETWMDEMRNEIQPVNCVFISLGVKADLSELPENMILPLDQPFEYAGHTHRMLGINNYANFEGYAPSGCTTLTMMFFEDTYDEWKRAKIEGIYEEKKQELAQQIIAIVEGVIPCVKDKIESWDIATPLTYERYCGTYRGSWMSVLKPNCKNQSYPCTSQSMNRLYFAGQRLVIPGGLPTALVTGRTAVQYLCKDVDVMFQKNI